MFLGKLPFWADRTLGASRMAVPAGAHRFWAKTWNGAQPPDMPTTAVPAVVP